MAVLFCCHLTLFAQTQNIEHKTTFATNSEILSVYPNPASDYIALTNEDNVKSIEVFNVLGRRIRSFEIEHTGERYDITDLPNGLYYLHVIAKNNNKPLLTLRLTKKS